MHFFSVHNLKSRDVGLCLIAAIAGIVVAELPASTAFSGHSVHPWIRAYVHLGKVMWTFPWSILVLCLLLVLLFLSNFKRGGVGVAFCIGIAIVKTIQNA